MRFYSDAYRDRRRLKPSDYPSGMGFFDAPANGSRKLGNAYPTSHIGGCRPGDGLGADYPPPELTWRLVLGFEVVDGRVVPLEEKQDLGDRWVLRLGEFVELAEDAE